MMFLAVDIGNTNIALGIFQNKVLVQHWQIRTDADKTCDEYMIILRGLLQSSPLESSQIIGAIISSVVPPPDSRLSKIVPGDAARSAFDRGAGIENRHAHSL